MFNLGVEEIPPKPRRKEKGIFFFQSTWNGTLGIPLGSWLFKAGSTATPTVRVPLPGGASPEPNLEHACKSGTSSRLGGTSLAGSSLQ